MENMAVKKAASLREEYFRGHKQCTFVKAVPVGTCGRKLAVPIAMLKMEGVKK